MDRRAEARHHPPRLFMPPARHQEFRRFGNEGPEGHEDQAARQIGEPKRAPAEDGFEPDREQAGRGIAADRSEPADKDAAPTTMEARNPERKSVVEGRRGSGRVNI